MRKFVLAVPAFAVCAYAASLPSGEPHPAPELYAGWLKMYDLKFDEAHRSFEAWTQSHPEDSLGPASNAAAYLFSELARLGALETEFFVDDSLFKQRPKLHPDASIKSKFVGEITNAERLADRALAASATDANALFVKSLTFGLRADNAALVEKQSLTALGLTKQGRIFSDRLLQANPQAFDAYLGPGVENYLLSLKAAPLRMLLRMSGSNVDRDKGLAEIRQTASHGYYLEPFAKLLLAVAALRDKDVSSAREILGELHRRFPDNDLYTRELNRLDAGVR